MKQNKTWVVVADGSRARILLYEGRKSGLRQLPHSGIHDINPATRDLVTDRPSRVHESVGSTRHAIEPRSDAHDQRKERFLEQLVSHLESAAAGNEFDHLVIVAPATAMGALRKDLSTQLKNRLFGEFVSDYVHQTNEYIYEQIKDGLPP